MLTQYALWQRTLGDGPTLLALQRSRLSAAFLSFRSRVAHLVDGIGATLPDLTVHDITHLDALWRVADEIAGSDYPLNPAEAFVLGGAFLLHDAAHVVAVYENGIRGIRDSTEWKDLVAQKAEGIEPQPSSQEEKTLLFQVLRDLHAKQARKLPFAKWDIDGVPQYLLDDLELREYYGELIGEIAESHHWPAHKVEERFAERPLNPPACLAPATWSVDTLKVALLLRVADAAHIDALRAPWFLFALRRPTGISEAHWRFQARLGQPIGTSAGQLRLTSGNAFSVTEQDAWWLAYDTALMIDRELHSAHDSLRESSTPAFRLTSVEGAEAPEKFALHVRTQGWTPTDSAPRISDVPKVISALGGAQLYGEDQPAVALRELVQNAADAIRALRAIGGLGENEGQIKVELTSEGGDVCLSVADTGIGMSRHVLLDVLLDFGRSMWTSDDLRVELPGLASSGFRPVGKFGIGFYSVFMLGEVVTVTTRRFALADGEHQPQWVLEFAKGLRRRPSLRPPTERERLTRPGTRVSVRMARSKFSEVLQSAVTTLWINPLLRSLGIMLRRPPPETETFTLDQLEVLAQLFPTLDIDVVLKLGDSERLLITARDWRHLSDAALLKRLGVSDQKSQLSELRESDGTMTGRVGSKSAGSMATVTHGGIRCGSVPQLVGVLLGTNNMELARQTAAPIASKEAWKAWAANWLDAVPERDFDAYVTLHPLCTERDLPVFRLGASHLTIKALIELLQHKESLVVFSGEPSHEDYDDISSQRFSTAFKTNPDVLFIPDSGTELARFLGFPVIDYASTVETILRQTWGDYDENEDDDYEVGTVDGYEIRRSVTIYDRPASSTDA